MACRSQAETPTHQWASWETTTTTERRKTMSELLQEEIRYAIIAGTVLDGEWSAMLQEDT